MDVCVLAQNLHSASRGVARALRERDEAYLRDLVCRLAELPIYGLDLGVADPDLPPVEETELLVWLAEIVAAESSLERFLDSARTAVLIAAAKRMSGSCSFNSIREIEQLSEKELEVLRGGDGTMIVQLAPQGRLPTGSEDRLRWAQAALDAAHRRELSLARIWIDPVCLPWGDDVEAGRGLLEFLEVSAVRWPACRSVVGLSNVSWGHGDRRRLHRQWLVRFLERGLGAVILDVFDEDLLSTLRL